MNTNDPKAPYTVKLNGPIEAATAPLLSDKEMDVMFCRHLGASPGETGNDALEEVRAFYEAKIASGELMVVITTKIEEVHTSDGIFFECVACGVDYPSSDALKPGEFCRCGAKIIEG